MSDAQSRRSIGDTAAASTRLAAAAAGAAWRSALPLVGSSPTWVTLTVAALAMGMMIFVMASGLTLVFGLMDVINFGHGAFIAVGAYVALLGAAAAAAGCSADPWRSISRRSALAIARRMVGTGALGWVFERVIVRPVYGQHLKQILVTMGGLIVAEQLIHVIWGRGSDRRWRCRPTCAARSLFGDAAVETLPAARGGGRAGGVRRDAAGAQPHPDRPADPRRRREPRDGRGAGLSHPPPVRRRVRGGLGAGRPRRRDVGALPGDAHRRHGLRGDGADVHRHHHRRAGLGRRLLPRRAAGGDDGELHRLPRAEDGAGLEHPADGADPAVAAAGPLSGGASADAMLSASCPAIRRAAAVLAVAAAGRSSSSWRWRRSCSPARSALNVAAKICVFIVLVASYDLLLGYTGIVSFAHTMFFGIGGYGVAHRAGASWGRPGRRSSLGIAACAGGRARAGAGDRSVLAARAGDLLRHDHARGGLVLSRCWPRSSPASPAARTASTSDARAAAPGFRLLETPVFGTAINGRSSPTTSSSSARWRCSWLLLRVVNSPFGRVLQAIRENDFRAEALGYRVVFYRTVANCLGALMARSRACLMALWLRYTGPGHDALVRNHDRHPADGRDRRHGHDVWRGDRRDAVHPGAELSAEPDEGRRARRREGIPLLPNLLHPDRWLLWLGVLFILSVYFFPTGIVGRLRR